MDTKTTDVEVNEEEVVEIEYRNRRGETTKTKIIPEHIFFGCVEWHVGEQWFLNAYDLERDKSHDIALKDILNWKPKIVEK